MVPVNLTHIMCSACAVAALSAHGIDYATWSVPFDSFPTTFVGAAPTPGADQWTALTPPNAFDSEGPQREGTWRTISTASIIVTGGPAQVIHPGGIPSSEAFGSATLAALEPASNFDSESPQREGEWASTPAGSAAASGGGTTARLGTATETDTALPIRAVKTRRIGPVID